MLLHFPQNPEFGTSEAFSEAQLKIAESEESIRQVAVNVTRAEARLAALREIGVDVSRWLEKAQEKAEKTQGEKHTLEPGGESLLTPRRACAARVTVLGLCVCVCLSVSTYSRTMRNKAARKRYQRVQCHTGLI